jgi:hypothetical protein
VNALRGLILPAAMIVIGVALIVKTLTVGFGIGVILGLLCIAAGAGRIYVERRL